MRTVVDLAKSAYKRVKFCLSPNLLEYFELGAYTNEWIVPKNIPTSKMDQLIPFDQLERKGLLFDDKNQLQKLKYWQANYLSIYQAIRDDQYINTQFHMEDYVHNGYYPTPDAEIYASMILDHKPVRILEIGGGFSTLIARKIISEAKLNCSIEVIDPKPRADIEHVADKIVLKNVEDIPFQEMNITQDTLLFIDSSHICRSTGDIPYLYCNILPVLPLGSLVHVHDIFLPYDYPLIYKKWLYNEQYILQGMLSYSQRYEILFSTHYLTRMYPGEMQATFGQIVGKDSRFYGASFWLRVK